MPTSHYFPQNYKNNASETNLYQDLVDEQIKLFGTDIYYINRKTYTENFTNDVIYSEYKDKIVIEAMLQNVEGFGAQSEFISKFGLRVTDEVTFTISARRWDEEYTRLLNIKVNNRPNEGDLVYFPLTGDLYEIKFVEREMPFYQLGKIYFYTMTCEIAEIGNDDIETGIPEIDKIEAERDASITLFLQDGGTGDYYDGDTVEYHTVEAGPVYTPTGIFAEVADWDAPNQALKLINMTGDFSPDYAVLKKDGSDLTVRTDGVWIIGPQDNTVYIEDTNSEYDDNKYIEDYADDILDFTEVNPFGEYGNLDDII